MGSRRGRVRAPELRGRGGWVNAPGGLSLKSLRGKVVLLDFWTFCCINCLHVLDELRPLEERFGNDLVVIGVHSPKFEHEKDHEALSRAVARYDVRHPVLDDPDKETWDQYGVRAWPTLILVDPAGYAVAAVSGEGNGRALQRTIEKMLDEHRASGTLDDSPVELLPPPVRSGPLRFPGKVAAGPDGLVAVADSGHNRVVVARRDGSSDEDARVEAVSGTGERGAADGTFSVASFAGPQGLLFLDKDTLLVADTGNHLIRRLRLRDGTVETVAGTGDQARWGASGGPALRSPLNSPWDLQWWEGRVAVAMAGLHQLWALDLEKGPVEVLAGNGMESLSDGSALAAMMAQPSGLSSGGDALWVVDSETSALRYLDHDGNLRTVVGSGLFDFGYADGPAPVARLQHPLGVAATPEGIVVCDTYNSALRRYDPESGELSTLARDGLAEPSGAAALDGGKLLVADTNNHRLALLSPDGEFRDFELAGLRSPGGSGEPGEAPAVVEIGQLELAGELTLSATAPVPEGEKLDASLGPPVEMSLYSEELLPDGGRLQVTGDELPVRVRLSLGAEAGTLEVVLKIGTCQDGRGAVCNVSEKRWRIGMRRDAEGSPRLNLGLGATG